ncbi:hypothetical protein ADUPG1_012977 [Aduncisulcus paluster]|uniref:Uncharacterized protein n=1 Tax=Aduncisulcus paluster TaxID=2918883 RepID=A0ABQ5K1B6_9EUKA|nr:hypothetical protein ADUPG1_012976 [Aduncisulcus paluster]GKT25246.1 hypothetical protein ADUPG1_012977 [Aduncisulcus paluster]
MESARPRAIGFVDDKFEEFKSEDWTPDTLTDEIDRHWHQNWSETQIDEKTISRVKNVLIDAGAYAESE